MLRFLSAMSGMYGPETEIGGAGGGAGVETKIENKTEPTIETKADPEIETKVTMTEAEMTQKINAALLAKEQELIGLRKQMEAKSKLETSKAQTLEEREAAIVAGEARVQLQSLTAYRTTEATKLGIPSYFQDSITIEANDTQETINTKIGTFNSLLETFKNEYVEDLKTRKIILTTDSHNSNQPKPGALGASLADAPKRNMGNKNPYSQRK
jgi:hypothetical protein